MNLRYSSWHTFFMIFDTFIKVDPFGSSTEKDATGGAHLFGPTADLCYWVTNSCWDTQALHLKRPGNIIYIYIYIYMAVSV